jgi:DNA-binding Lrp family transcriptional regulator
VREKEALAIIARWCEQGVIRRFGIIVRHHELGFRANAMVVWDVPDDVVSMVGRNIAASGRVTLCYRRPRQLPHWPYNLFCMIHGKDREEVEAHISSLSTICALDTYPHATLFSQRRFKQCGARYQSPADEKISAGAPSASRQDRRNLNLRHQDNSKESAHG